MTDQPAPPTLPTSLPFASMLVQDNVAIVSDWLAAAGQLYVNLYLPMATRLQ